MLRKFFSRKILKFIIPLFVFTSFAFISQKTFVETSAWSGTQTSTAGAYYASVGSETGESLKSKLKTIISSPKPSTSYDWPRYEAADEAEGVSDSVLLLYSRKIVKKTAHVSGSQGWNREHSFPKSKLSGAGATSDNHLIFADDVKTNSTRGNNPFGVVAETTSNRVSDSYGNPTNSYSSGGFFMPTPEARGEVARATMYVNTLYNLNVTSNFSSVALMLEWHLAHPVTNRDIFRNNTVHTKQNNRNPYVDHPEYACKVYGDTNSATKSLCAANSGPVDVTGISLSPKNETISLQGSTSLQMHASVLPNNATNKGVVWTSSNPSVATISSSGVLLAKSVGNTTITVTSSENSALKDSTTINVTNTPINVTGISITNQNVSVGVNKKVMLDIEITPSNATNKSVTWSSSNPSVASVNAAGEVKGLKVGTSTISVTTVDGNKNATVLVTVANVPTLSSVVGDFRNGTANNTGITNFDSNDLNNGDPGTGTLNYSGFGGKDVVKSVNASQSYLPRSGGLAIGSGSNSGNLKITLNEAYATKKVDVLFMDAGKNVSITLKGNPEIGTMVSGTVGSTADDGVPYSLTFTNPQTVFDISSTYRVAMVEIVIYLEVEAEEEHPEVDATAWGNEFLELTNFGCETSNHDELYSAWQLSEDSFLDLSEEAQGIIRTTIPLYSTSDDLSHARARYAVIRESYSFYDFIGGEDEYSINNEANNNTNNILVFVVVFLFGMLALNGYFFLKNKQGKQS